MDRKLAAMSGWGGELPLQRHAIPGEATKWYTMMGAADLIPDSRREATRTVQEPCR